MAKLLVHIHSSQEMKNKVTLGLLVAVTGVKNGHEVKLFLAADGVHILNCKNEGEVVGQGTGDVKVHLDALKEAKTKILFQACLRKHVVMMIVFWKGLMPNLQCLTF